MFPGFLIPLLQQIPFGDLLNLILKHNPGMTREQILAELKRQHDVDAEQIEILSRDDS